MTNKNDNECAHLTLVRDQGCKGWFCGEPYCNFFVPEHPETGCAAAPVAVSDLLAECARRFAGDVGLSRPHPLWGAIEAYENARATDETPDEQTCQHMVTVLWRSLNRLHHAVKECARIGFQESSPTGDARHFAIWTDLNDAQKDAELKLKHFSAGLPVKTSGGTP